MKFVFDQEVLDRFRDANPDMLVAGIKQVTVEVNDKEEPVGCHVKEDGPPISEEEAKRYIPLLNLIADFVYSNLRNPDGRSKLMKFIVN